MFPPYRIVYIRSGTMPRSNPSPSTCGLLFELWIGCCVENPSCSDPDYLAGLLAATISLTHLLPDISKAVFLQTMNLGGVIDYGSTLTR